LLGKDAFRKTNWLTFWFCWLDFASWCINLGQFSEIREFWREIEQRRTLKLLIETMIS
jgi:hypothetical protein